MPRRTGKTGGHTEAHRPAAANAIQRRGQSRHVRGKDERHLIRGSAKRRLRLHDCSRLESAGTLFLFTFCLILAELCSRRSRFIYGLGNVFALLVTFAYQFCISLDGLSSPPPGVPARLFALLYGTGSIPSFPCWIRFDECQPSYRETVSCLVSLRTMQIDVRKETR